MMISLAVFASVINILLLIIKFRKKRYADVLLDSAILVAVFTVLSGSEAMLLIGTFTSCAVSIYLWFSPPQLGVSDA